MASKKASGQEFETVRTRSSSKLPRALRKIWALDDFQIAAKRHLPLPIYAYYASAVETEITLRANRTDFDDYEFIPRFLTDTSKRDQSVELFDKTYSAPFGERFDLFQRDRSRKGFFSPNLKPTVLKSELESPKDFAMASLWDVSASTGIPSSELIGEQSGKMAGEKDSESFAIAMNSRSNSHGTMMIRKTIDWMIKFGILPDADYEVEWQDLLAPSQDERLENAAKMAKTNLDQFKAGQDAVYSPEQIIETGGFDVEDLDDDLNDDLEDLDIDPKEPTDGD